MSENKTVLNKGQLAAVRHGEGPMMVLAGPGSGKTTVIAHRIGYMIQELGVDPYHILVITFTKAAAGEMKKRLCSLLGENAAGALSIFTFHALFFRILRAHTGIGLEDVLQEDKRNEALRNILTKTGVAADYDEELLKSVSAEISLIKNDLIDMRYYNSMSLGNEDFKNVLTLYEDYKKAFKKLDFDDMLEKCYGLLSENSQCLHIWQNRFRHILIDEFQDINKAQYSTIKLLAAGHQNIYIVGDDDQSIYRFRGARPEFLLNFPKDYPETKRAVLDMNYRSSDEIIGLANRVIKNNVKRYDKAIQGTGRKGPRPKLIKAEDPGREALHIAETIKALNAPDLTNICVIYRVNIQARALIDAFMNQNIPFQVRDEMPHVYEHWISRDVNAYMRLALHREDERALERIINKPNRFISNQLIKSARKSGMGIVDYLYTRSGLKHWQLARIEELMFYLNAVKKRTPQEAFKYIRQAAGYDNYLKDYAEYRKMDTKGLYEILDDLQEAAKAFGTIDEYLAHVDTAIAENKRQKDSPQRSDGVVFSTMHGVKGLEFDTVFITSCNEGLIPYEKSRTESEIEEERRLFYVALTRAREHLFLSVIKNRHENEMEPTRFLNGIIKIEL